RCLVCVSWCLVGVLGFGCNISVLWLGCNISVLGLGCNICVLGFWGNISVLGPGGTVGESPSGLLVVVTIFLTGNFDRSNILNHGPGHDPGGCYISVLGCSGFEDPDRGLIIVALLTGLR
ncbi:unnamed protein product, partial [Meganyctiphanes norvegica]